MHSIGALRVFVKLRFKENFQPIAGAEQLILIDLQTIHATSPYAYWRTGKGSTADRDGPDYHRLGYTNALTYGTLLA